MAARSTETGDLFKAEKEWLLQNSSQSPSEASSRENQKPQTTKHHQNTPSYPQPPNKTIANPYAYLCCSHIPCSKQRANGQTLLGYDGAYTCFLNWIPHLLPKKQHVDCFRKQKGNAIFRGPVLTEWVYYFIIYNLFLAELQVKKFILKIWPFTFCALMGPARGCFCLCSFGSGSLSVDFSESTGPTSLSLPLEAGAPNWIVSMPRSTPPSCPGFVP